MLRKFCLVTIMSFSIVAIAFIATWFFRAKREWDSRAAEVEKDLRMHREIMLSMAATEKENNRLLSGRDTRIWKTPTRDFFKSPALNELCKSIAEVDERKFEELLEKDLDLNEIGEDGMTVLFFAYMEGEFPGYMRLLERGAESDSPLTETQEVLPKRPLVEAGETVMFAACRRPDYRYRYILPAIAHANNRNLQDSRGHTVLHLLVGLGGPIVKSTLLLIKDSDIDPMIKDNAGKTARDYAVAMAPETVPIFDEMIEKAVAKRNKAFSVEEERNRSSIGEKQ